MPAAIASKNTMGWLSKSKEVDTNTWWLRIASNTVFCGTLPCKWTRCSNLWRRIKRRTDVSAGPVPYMSAITVGGSWRIASKNASGLFSWDTRAHHITRSGSPAERVRGAEGGSWSRTAGSSPLDSTVSGLITPWSWSLRAKWCEGTMTCCA